MNDLIFDLRVWMFSAIGTFLTAFVITLIAVLSPRESPEQFNIKVSEYRS